MQQSTKSMTEKMQQVQIQTMEQEQTEKESKMKADVRFKRHCAGCYDIMVNGECHGSIMKAKSTWSVYEDFQTALNIKGIIGETLTQCRLEVRQVVADHKGKDAWTLAEEAQNVRI